MILRLYKLESDSDGSEEALCSFSEGNYVLGRGAPLLCEDKRISRKQAEIDVNDSGASLTAKHEINPCFYRSSGKRQITILKYNIPVLLNDGDSFGFLPDKFWFKVKIALRRVDTTNGRKRSGENAEENVGRKFVKTAESSDVHEGNVTEGLDAHEDVNEVEMETATAANDICQSDVTESEAVIEAQEVTDVSNSNNLDVIRNDESETTEVTNASNNLDVIRNDESKTTEVTDALNLNTPTGLRIKNIANLRETIPMTDESNSNERHTSPSTSTSSRLNPGVRTESKESGDTSVGVVIKTENINEMETPPSSPRLNEVVTPVRIKQEPNDSSVDASRPSTSGEANHDVKKEKEDSDSETKAKRRERCWYGPQCYRKNDAHKAQFAHEGDADYDSDPGDARPSCSYGIACYRRNKLHREQYRHPKGKRPKPPRRTPTNAIPGTGTQGTAPLGNQQQNGTDPSRPRRTNRTVVRTYIDDYVYPDPFGGDSSDEYHLDSDEESEEEINTGTDEEEINTGSDEVENEPEEDGEEE